MLHAIADYAKNDRAEFVRAVQETQAKQQAADITKKKKRLAAAQKRAGELKKLICKICEDNALGKLPDTRYAALDAQYAKEQDELSSEIDGLEKVIGGYEQSKKSAERFIALIDKYENFDTLTNTMLKELVKKILVHERARRGSQETTQEVEIYFNFVGKYVPPYFGEVTLIPEEQEELRKKEERKDRLHQNYLRRKANGKQREYEERTKTEKRQKMEVSYSPPFFAYTVFLLIRFLPPHAQIISNIGINDFPLSESLYSTLGGTCGYSVLVIILSCSSSFNVKLKVLCDMLPTFRLSSLYRITSHSAIQNIINILYFPPISESV